MVGEETDLDNLRLLALGKFCASCLLFGLFSHILILFAFIDRLLLIVRITTTHKMSHRDHTIKITTVISTGHRVTILKPLTMGRPIEVAILGFEGTTKTKAQVADSLDLDLIPTTMGLRTAEEGVISTIHNGLYPDLVVAVDRQALLHSAVVRGLHLLLLRPQVIRYLLGHPILRLNRQPQTGITKETMTGLCLLKKAMVLMKCPRLPVIRI